MQQGGPHRCSTVFLGFSALQNINYSDLSIQKWAKTQAWAALINSKGQKSWNAGLMIPEIRPRLALWNSELGNFLPCLNRAESALSYIQPETSLLKKKSYADPKRECVSSHSATALKGCMRCAVCIHVLESVSANPSDSQGTWHECIRLKLR